MWKEARHARELMRERGLDKTPGCSSIEVNGIVHEFVVSDASHALFEQICECLASLTGQMELPGFTHGFPAFEYSISS